MSKCWRLEEASGAGWWPVNTFTTAGEAMKAEEKRKPRETRIIPVFEYRLDIPRDRREASGLIPIWAANLEEAILVSHTLISYYAALHPKVREFEANLFDHSPEGDGPVGARWSTVYTALEMAVAS